MTYKEEIGSLFDMPKDYYLAHCISADFALGAGIAIEFNRRYNMRNELFRHYFRYWKKFENVPFTGSCILINKVFNLVTKKEYWLKPTLQTMSEALNKMKIGCTKYNVKKLAMPKIGCGLDKLNWEDVSKLIQDIFKDTDIEIVIRKLD